MHEIEHQRGRMTSPSMKALDRTKRRKIILALGAACELCGRVAPVAAMEIHLCACGGGGERGADEPCAGDGLLVLCPVCHYQLHEYGILEDEERALIREREPRVRRLLRRILAAETFALEFPEPDLELLYREGIPMHWRWAG